MKLVVFVIAALAVIHGSGAASAVTGMDSYYAGTYAYNDSYIDSGVNNYINATVDFIVNTAAAGGASSPSKTGQETTAFEADSLTLSLSNVPIFTVAMTIETISVSNDDDKFRLLMYVENTSPDDASNCTLDINLMSGLLMDETSLTPITSADLTSIYARRMYTWNIGTLSSSTSVTASFTADVDRGNMVGYNYYSSEVVYYDAASNEFGPQLAEVCIHRTINEESSVLYQHGFTALTFFMALLLGVLLVCLGFFIYFMMRRRKTISPTKANNQERMIVERGKTIMLDEHDAMKRTGHTINDYSVIGEGDSIVGVLAMKDKMQMHREIDSLDIVNTVNVDTNLEKERNDASMATTELLLTGLHSNNDINKSTLDHALGNMRSRRVHMDKQQDEDYKRDMKKLYKKISAKNRAMMNTLMNKQHNEKKELVSNTRNLPAEDRNGLIKLMNEQHLSEQNAETYKLKLEQDEETENLRKEFAIRSRMGLKEIQLQALNDARDQGKLSDQQIKWLLSEHQKTQKNLESLYDDEISRQRMVLEEKLARRKALAQSAETLEEDNDDLLNTVAGQQVTTIQAMKKSKAISSADANVLIDQAKQDMIAIKNKMEKDRATQENELHKRLSNLKKKRLNDLAKEQEAEIREYDKKSAEMQTDGPVDPTTYVEGRLKLLSQQRVERSTLDTEIDKENLKELEGLRTTISTQTETELRTVSNKLNDKLQNDSKDKLDRLMREHAQETEALRSAQERNRQKQLRKLQDRLEENREQWNQRKETEKLEQEQLREYEDNVVSKLMNSQVSMSDDERERILKEHEKQMVKLENSLTLNKLRQKRMIEDKIAQRRAAQMEKLQMKQYAEKESQRRQMKNNAEDSQDEDVQKEKAALMKDHVEQKMAVLHGRKMDWETELESIRVEMLKERSLALKEQEEKLGALVAELQLSKAKELAKIEEQQRAIHNLKTNLIDDLNDRGVLSDPETQAVIQRHQEEQEQLTQRLDHQRNKQEQMLREKLQARLQQREKSMVVKQDEELKALTGTNKTALKVKKMLLIHKHMVAMEKMRNKLEREISQTLEQVRYEYEICKRKAIQDQEMEFIAGLVRVGTIPKDDLESVLQMLYPGKSEQEMKEIMDKIFDPKLQSKQPPMDHQEASKLLSRVRKTQDNPPPFLRRASQLSLYGSRPSSRNSSMRGSKKKGGLDSGMYSTARDQQQLYDHDHYQDDTRFRPSSRQHEDTLHYQRPGHELDEMVNPRSRSSSRQYEENSRFHEQVRYAEEPRFKVSSRQSYDHNDAPHPLEQSFSPQDSMRSSTRGSLRSNGHAYGNTIMEEDDDVVTANYMSHDKRQHIPSKLPPLQQSSAGGNKKKKKKKFLKKMAEHSPRTYDDDDY